MMLNGHHGHCSLVIVLNNMIKLVELAIKGFNLVDFVLGIYRKHKRNTKWQI